MDPLREREQARRIQELWDWKRDTAGELRELEQWRDSVKPFLDQLQADLIYRQRKHAEAVGEWSTLAKIVATAAAGAVALSAVGGFVIQIMHAIGRG